VATSVVGVFMVHGTQTLVEHGNGHNLVAVFVQELEPLFLVFVDQVLHDVLRTLLGCCLERAVPKTVFLFRWFPPVLLLQACEVGLVDSVAHGFDVARGV